MYITIQLSSHLSMMLMVSIEKAVCLSTVPNILHFQSIFALSWGKRQLKAAEVSWGCCLLFAHVPLFFSPVHLQALPTPLSQGWWKHSRLRICIPQSPAQSPRSGSQCSSFQGWLKAGKFSSQPHWCSRQTLQRAFPLCIPSLIQAGLAQVCTSNAA